MIFFLLWFFSKLSLLILLFLILSWLRIITVNFFMKHLQYFLTWFFYYFVMIFFKNYFCWFYFFNIKLVENLILYFFLNIINYNNFSLYNFFYKLTTTLNHVTGLWDRPGMALSQLLSAEWNFNHSINWEILLVGSKWKAIIIFFRSRLRWTIMQMKRLRSILNKMTGTWNRPYIHCFTPSRKMRTKKRKEEEEGTDSQQAFL